jgi:hypothetical protein
MSLGRLVVDLVANTGQFIQGMNSAATQAQSSAGKISTSFKELVQAQIVADTAMNAFHASVEKVAKAFDNAGQAVDSEQMFGTTAEKFNNMRYAIDLTGDSFESISKVMSALQQELSTTGSASEGTGKLITKMGLDFRELKEADPTDALKMVANSLQSIDDPTTRARVGTALLGKGYKEAANALQNYAAASAEGSGITAEMLTSMDDLSDALAGLGARSDNLSMAFAGTLAPAILDVTKAMSGAKDESAATGKIIGESVTPAIYAAAQAAAWGVKIFKEFGLGFATIGKRVAAELSGNFDQSREIAAQARATTVSIENDYTLATHRIRQAQQGLANSTVANDKKTQEAADAAAASRKKYAALLASLSGGGKVKESPIEKEFRKIQEETLKARLELRDYNIEKFKLLKPTAAQVTKFTLMADTLQAETALKAFRDEMKGLNLELANADKTETQKALNTLRTKLVEAKVPAEDVEKAVARLHEALNRKSDFQFTKDLEAMNAEISKIGKTAQVQEEVDIRLKFRDDENPQHVLDALAANGRKYAAQTAEQVDDMMRKLQQERDLMVPESETPLTQYILDLKEAARLNQGFTPQIQATAIALKKENLDLAKSYKEHEQAGNDATSAITGGLGDILNGTVTAAQGFKNLTKAVADLIVKYTILKPLENALDGAFSGGSGGGGIIGAGIDWLTSGSGHWNGGGVGANTMYPVAEQGAEVYESGGKSFLITGSQGGNITPLSNASGAGGSTVVINQNVTIDARGADASVDQKIREAMKSTKQETLAAVQLQTQRGAMLRGGSR